VISLGLARSTATCPQADLRLLAQLRPGAGRFQPGCGRAAHLLAVAGGFARRPVVSGRSRIQGSLSNSSTVYCRAFLSAAEHNLFPRCRARGWPACKGQEASEPCLSFPGEQGNVGPASQLAITRRSPDNKRSVEHPCCVRPTTRRVLGAGESASGSTPPRWRHAMLRVIVKLRRILGRSLCPNQPRRTKLLVFLMRFALGGGGAISWRQGQWRSLK